MSENLSSVINQEQESVELLQRVVAVISDQGLTQSNAAKEIGLSVAALNQWLQGKYKGDNNEVKNKLIKWLAACERRKDANETRLDRTLYISTPTGSRIKNVLSYTQAAADLSVIYGGAGVGKTRAIKNYAALSPNVWVATMRPDTSGVASCLEEISEAVGIKMPGRASRQSRDLSRRLENTAGLLIIDEAQHLSLNAVESVRSIHDASCIGLVLCGNESVYARLTGGTRAATFAQLFSRIGKRLRLSQPSKADVNALADAYNITGKEELQALWNISQKPGALRAVVKTLNFAGLMANGNNHTVNLQYILAAWQELGGET